MLQLPLYLVANERPLINIDATLFINIGLWLFLFIVLRAVFWGPMIRLISAREGGTTGSRDEARKLSAEARAKEAEYREAQKTARANAAATREKLRADAAKREAEILGAARAKMSATVEAQRVELRKQHDAIRTELRGSVPALAADIASKVLGREVQS